MTSSDRGTPSIVTSPFSFMSSAVTSYRVTTSCLMFFAHEIKASNASLPKTLCVTFNNLFFEKNIKGASTIRGVPRLGDKKVNLATPWDKKQVWRPHVRALGLSEANILHWRKCLWHCWDFPTPLQSFGATIVIQHPGNCAPLAPRYAPANKTRLVRYLVHRVRWSLFQLLYVVLLPISLNPVKVCNCTRYKFLHTISSRLLLVFLRCCTFESSTWRAKLTSFRQPPVPRLSWNKQNK